MTHPSTTSHTRRDDVELHPDAWLAAVHHTGDVRGFGLFVAFAAALAFGILSITRGEITAGIVVVVVTVALYGLWLSWGHLTALLHATLGLQLRRLRMMGVNVVAVSEGLIIDTAESTSYVSWSDLQTNATIPKPGDGTMRVHAPARNRRRRCSIRLLTRWSDITDATPGSVTVDLADFLAHNEISALAAAISPHRPDLADIIITRHAEKRTPKSSAPTEKYPPIETRLPADDDSWIASSFTRTLPARIVRNILVWLVAIAFLVVVFGDGASSTPAGFGLLAGSAFVVFCALFGRILVDFFVSSVCVFLGVDDPHVERIRRLGTHVTATCTGLIIDTPDRTVFLPWTGIRTVPQGFATRSVDIHDDAAARSATIIGDGFVITGRRRTRRVGTVRGGNLVPTRVSVDVDDILGSPNSWQVNAVIRHYCAGLPVADSHDAPAEVDKRRFDLWLVSTQLSYVGLALLSAAYVCGFVALVALGITALAVLPRGQAVAVVLVALFALFAAQPICRLLLELAYRPPRRIVWAGCHLAVTAEGFILTTRGRTDTLRWRDITGVETRQMDRLQARLSRIPAIERPTLVGDGVSTSHVFPVRFIRRFTAYTGPRSKVRIDPEVFLTTEDTGELLWTFRPDLAAALGYPQPRSTDDDRGRPVVRSAFRGTVVSRRRDGGTRVLLCLPESRTAIIDYSADRSRIDVHGDLPTVSVVRTGPRHRRRSPIGTYDARRLSLTIDGTPMEIARIRRSPMSPHRHQFAITDGTGNLFTLAPSFVVSGNSMAAANGIRRCGTGITVHRLVDGRVDITPANAYDGEIALSLALAAALGTRSVQLASVRYLPAMALAAVLTTP